MWSFCHFCIFIIFILLYTHFTFCAINYCFCTPELFDIRTCQGLVREMWWACKEQPPVLWGRTVFLGSALLDCNRSPHSCTTNHTLSLSSMVISSQSYVSFEAWVVIHQCLVATYMLPLPPLVKKCVKYREWLFWIQQALGNYFVWSSNMLVPSLNLYKARFLPKGRTTRLSIHLTVLYAVGTSQVTPKQHYWLLGSGSI